jgi:hypothetical protein
MTSIPTTTHSQRRIGGVVVNLERESDGIQRQEWLSHPGGSTIGTVLKAKWNYYDLARRFDGTEKVFAVQRNRTTTDQAFTLARLWVVAKEIEA